ncbi:ATP-binding protein [Streptomyces sp. NPDC088725]|uniref:ATP-binding protein n=1 Tax=Streptomyces sp. NPDC088725 TaxID=3365873 RepID=UPI003814A565
MPAPRRVAPRPLPRTPAEARALVQAVLHERWYELDELVIADALLVTSELTTNAVRHGGGITRFEARIADDCLVLLIADRSSAPPAALPRQGEDPSQGGYGWPLIRRLTREITVIPALSPGGPGGAVGGKQILAVVDLRQAPPTRGEFGSGFGDGPGGGYEDDFEEEPEEDL